MGDVEPLFFLIEDMDLKGAPVFHENSCESCEKAGGGFSGVGDGLHVLIQDAVLVPGFEAQDDFEFFIDLLHVQLPGGHEDVFKMCFHILIILHIRSSVGKCKIAP